MKPKNFKWRKRARQKFAGLDVVVSPIPKDIRIRVGKEGRVAPDGDAYILNKQHRGPNA